MKKSLLYGVGALLALTSTSCVDDDYDLSDIDTTARVEVKDLTVPVNIAPFTLESIFDIDENDPDSPVKKVDGKYAIVREGTFSSTDIRFNNIHLSSSGVQTAVTSINTGVSGILPPGVNVEIPLTTDNISISYSSSAVPVEIHDIDKVGADFSIRYTLEFGGFNGTVRRLLLSDVEIEFPKGLDGTVNVGQYYPEDGKIIISNRVLTSPKLEIVMNCSALDFKALGGKFDAAGHTASVDLGVRIASGKLSFTSDDITGSVSSVLTLSSSAALSDIDVRTFSGTVSYAIEGVNIESVSLNDLPDVFSQKETYIIIQNPQIYLGVHNPLSVYGVEAQSGMTIKSNFVADNGDVTTTTHSLDGNGIFKVGSAQMNNVCLSPVKPEPFASGFENSAYFPFTSLRTVLAGNGLPSTIDIALDNPGIFEQPVKNLPIGVEIGSVYGSYRFLAPLSFGKNSKVVYTETKDGWNDEDIDAITIETMKVSATVTSQLPIDVDFEAYPVDINGKEIDVPVKGARVPANAKDYKLEITITGKITHLDGIRFTATGFIPEDMNSSLVPEQSIDCKDIRATVSGYYQKEL